jgi:hypothetical protein
VNDRDFSRDRPVEIHHDLLRMEGVVVVCVAATCGTSPGLPCTCRRRDRPESADRSRRRRSTKP